jgi:hypothetical protein
MASGSVYQWISKGVRSNTGTYMTWWKTNFNMPVPDLFGNLDADQIDFGWTFYGQQSSYDLSGFLPGWELFLGTTVVRFEGPCSSDSGTIYTRWRNTVGNTMFTFTMSASIPSMDSGEWYQYITCSNQGVAGWEVSTNGTYTYESWTQGYSQSNFNLPTAVALIGITNCPSTTALSSAHDAKVWVEGNDLCYICANHWKHNIVGDYQSTTIGGEPGAIWIDTFNHYLYWTNSTGASVYRVPWIIDQFASTFTNGAPSNPAPGAGVMGSIWIDNQFGWTHISYIAADGRKKLVGSGHYPYQTPY